MKILLYVCILPEKDGDFHNVDIFYNVDDIGKTKVGLLLRPSVYLFQFSSESLSLFTSVSGLRDTSRQNRDSEKDTP